MNTFRFNRQEWLVKSISATELVAEIVIRPTGALLLAERTRLGLTTRDMATRLGISQSKLVKLENGTQWQSLEAVLEAARKL